jgi:hypothetical protein
MSICAKGVGKGVHNIAFSLSRDRFRAFDLFFFALPQPRMGAMTFLDAMTLTTKGCRASTKAEMCMETSWMGL